jgi:hypothetical protein
MGRSPCPKTSTCILLSHKENVKFTTVTNATRACERARWQPTTNRKDSLQQVCGSASDKKFTNFPSGTVDRRAGCVSSGTQSKASARPTSAAGAKETSPTGAQPSSRNMLSGHHCQQPEGRFGAPKLSTTASVPDCCTPHRSQIGLRMLHLSRKSN